MPKKPVDYEALPWPDRYLRDEQGNTVRRYSHWFVMQVLKELGEARDQKWTDMVRELGIRAQANSMPVKIPPQGAVVALSWFDTDLPIVEYVPPDASRASAALALTVDFVDLPTDVQIVSATDPIVLDPDVLGDAVNRHSRAVNFLAAAVRGNGWNPELLTSWFSEKPDLVWTDSDNILNVAEVKGLTSNNELSQMRLGLGQVLRYRYRAIAACQLVQAWLVTDSPPLDRLWGPLCDFSPGALVVAGEGLAENLDLMVGAEAFWASSTAPPTPAATALPPSGGKSVSRRSAAVVATDGNVHGASLWSQPVGPCRRRKNAV